MTKQFIHGLYKRHQRQLASKLSSAASPDKECNNDISVAGVHEKGSKIMKKFSKSRTALFIPGFRKSKRSVNYKKDANQIGPLIVEGEVLDYVSPPKSLASSKCLDGSNSGDDSSSIRSSVSSLEAVLVDNKRTISIDSGIDCQTSSSMLQSCSSYDLKDKAMYKSKALSTEVENVVGGRAPIASPEDDSLLEVPKSDLISSPKRTKLNSDHVHHNSSVSFGTLSDCSSCSCDSCDFDSDSDSDSDGHSKGAKGSSSNSISDYRHRRDDDHISDSDSDYSCSMDDGHSSDSSQCSDSFDDPKCYFTSVQNNSSWSNSFVNKMPANYVNTSSVNNIKSKKLTKKSSIAGKMSSTSKLVKKLTKKLNKSSTKNSTKTQKKADKLQQNTSKVSLESSRVCVSPPHVKNHYKYNHHITSTPINVKSSSSNKESSSSKSASQNVVVNRSVDNTSHVMRRPQISYSDDLAFNKVKKHPVERKGVVSFSEDLLEKEGLIYKPIERKPFSALYNGNPRVKNVKLNRSASDVSAARKPRIRTVPQLRCNTENQSSDSFINVSCDIDGLVDIDTYKSPVDVQQAMEKTAFWIENNGYDSNPDEMSTKSLLKQNREVNEKDLCDKIIGIYFSEESDSSLSSTCLDNSAEQDSNSSLSLSEEETSNLMDESNELTVATFVPAPYPTLQATTRKIITPESETPSPEGSNKLMELHRKKMELEKLQQKETILKEKINNLSSHQPRIKTVPSIPDKKVPSSHLCCDSRPASQLSEQEMETITKLHTVCNGQRMVRYLNKSESQMIIKHFPPPKSASRIVWDEKLENVEEVYHSPIKDPVRPRSILCQRSINENFPYEDDKPSPIVITRIRRSKSSRKEVRDWPW